MTQTVSLDSTLQIIRLEGRAWGSLINCTPPLQMESGLLFISPETQDPLWICWWVCGCNRSYRKQPEKGKSSTDSLCDWLSYTGTSVLLSQFIRSSGSSSKIQISQSTMRQQKLMFVQGFKLSSNRSASYHLLSTVHALSLQMAWIQRCPTTQMEIFPLAKPTGVCVSGANEVKVNSYALLRRSNWSQLGRCLSVKICFSTVIPLH